MHWEKTRPGKIRLLAQVVVILAAHLPCLQEGGAEQKPKPGGELQEIRVHSHSLASNLLADSADQGVLVYLPPRDSLSPSRRYPVVILPAGYSTGTHLLEDWGEVVKEPMDQSISENHAQ